MNKAMGRKLSLMEKSFYYDLLYNCANELFLTYNPCQIKSNGKCIANRTPTSTWSTATSYYENFTGCCRPSCKYITPGGCSTNSLGCKLFVCYTIQDRFPEFGKEIDRLKKIFRDLGLLKKIFWDLGLSWNVYESKEDWMDRKDGKGGV